MFRQVLPAVPVMCMVVRRGYCLRLMSVVHHSAVRCQSISYLGLATWPLLALFPLCVLFFMSLSCALSIIAMIVDIGSPCGMPSFFFQFFCVPHSVFTHFVSCNVSWSAPLFRFFICNVAPFSMVMVFSLGSVCVLKLNCGVTSQTVCLGRLC